MNHPKTKTSASTHTHAHAQNFLFPSHVSRVSESGMVTTPLGNIQLACSTAATTSNVITRESWVVVWSLAYRRDPQSLSRLCVRYGASNRVGIRMKNVPGSEHKTFSNDWWASCRSCWRLGRNSCGSGADKGCGWASLTLGVRPPSGCSSCASLVT